MQCDDNCLRTFYLEDRIPLPSPFPAIGTLQIETVTIPLSQSAGTRKDIKLMIVLQQLDVGKTVRRAVRADQVITFLPMNPDAPIDLAKGDWVLQEFADDNALRTAATNVGQTVSNTSPPRGIIFVPEDARVVMQVEHATTAAASSELPLDGCCSFLDAAVRDGCC